MNKYLILSLLSLALAGNVFAADAAERSSISAPDLVVEPGSNSADAGKDSEEKRKGLPRWWH
ncbi:MAG: hypothetical protein V4812_22760 [Pseudomonadota bacterium]